MISYLLDSFAIETAGLVARIHTKSSVAAVGSVVIVTKPVPGGRVCVAVM